MHYLCTANASLAQLVEHDTLNVGVLGSSPRGSTAMKGQSDDCPFFIAGYLWSVLPTLQTSLLGENV